MNDSQLRAAIPAGQGHVKASHAWVTLSGEVVWNYQRQAAESSVRRLSGVINTIAIAPMVASADVRQQHDHKRIA